MTIVGSLNMHEETISTWCKLTNFDLYPFGVEELVV